MLALAILFVLTVVLPPLGFGPPMYRGGHAENNIVMVRALPRTAPFSKPIEAQEVAEWWCAWLAGCLLALPVALLVPGLVGTAATLVAAFLGNLLARKATLHFDYVGHNVEIMVAEREGWIGYREAEIDRMIERGDQRGMSRADVARRLRRWAWLARVVLLAFKRRYG